MPGWLLSAISGILAGGILGFGAAGFCFAGHLCKILLCDRVFCCFSWARSSIRHTGCGGLLELSCPFLFWLLGFCFVCLASLFFLTRLRLWLVGAPLSNPQRGIQCMHERNSFNQHNNVRRPGVSHRGAGRKKKQPSRIVSSILASYFGSSLYCGNNADLLSQTDKWLNHNHENPATRKLCGPARW